MSFFTAIAPTILGGIGQLVGASQEKKQAEKQQQTSYEQQKEFARYGVRWRKADAEAAGIHPLAALGANTMSFSPQSVGTPDYSSIGRDFGQNVSRAVRAGMDSHSRKMADLQVQNMELRNHELATEIEAKKSLINANKNPPMAGVEINPAARIMSPKGKLDQEIGHHPEKSWSMSKSGVLVPVPSKDFAEKTEDAMLPKALWNYRNYIEPMLGGQDSVPPKKYLPKGYNSWEFSILKGGYIPVKKGRKKVKPFAKQRKWWKRFFD